METKMRNTLKFSAVLLLVLALLGSGLYRWDSSAATLPGTSCTGTGTVTCELWAKAGSFTPAGGSATTIWGYTDSAVGLVTAPGGPALIVNQGDTVTVTLHNDLGENTGLLFQGQTMTPDTSGVAAGGTQSYTFTASQPGTYLYQASPLLASGSAHQSAMGMYGALIVKSTTSGTAYGSSASAFDEETLLVFSEIDPALNNSATPATFDLRNYHPTVFLINGKSYPDTDTINVTGGNTILLRMVNAGLQSHSISTLGLTQNIIAVDGRAFNNGRKLTADTMFPGQTSDVLVGTSVLAQNGTRYAIYDAAFILSNNTSSGFGGMLIFINITGGTVIGGDTVGPLSTNLWLSQVRVAGGSVTFKATVSDAVSGGNNIQAAEYYIDSTSGSAVTLSASDGFFDSPTEDVETSLPIDANALATGKHTIYVRGQDTSGNWGAFSSIVLTVDKDGPIISGAQLIPNPSNGTVSIALEASADDRATGNSPIAAVEYSSDGGGSWNAMDYQTSASTYFYTASLSPAAGTIQVRATDDLNNIGPTVSLTLTIDTTGPVTFINTITPGSTNGVDQSVNSSVAAVRVAATFTDGVSNLSAAEGFIGAAGVPGTGFPFIATDGVFDSLSETGYADIPLSTFWVLPPGNYQITVRAKDASGNWGAPVTGTITVTAHP